MLTHPLSDETNDRPRLYSLRPWASGFGARAGYFSGWPLVCALLLAGSCASSDTAQGPRQSYPHTAPTPIPSPGNARCCEADTRVAVQTEGGGIERLALDDYVRGTVAAEVWVPSSENPEVAERIFELQALVARTYAAANLGRHAAEGFDLCSGTHCQLFRKRTVRGKWTDAIADAVARTRGQVILFDNAPILALFHANCGGATSAAQAIWGGTARPYLVSVADGQQCARAPGATWRTPLAREALTRVLDEDPRTSVGGRLDSIDIVQGDAAGRALLVGLTGARSPVVRGEELRVILGRAFGPRSVRSPRFTVTREGDHFIFAGTGIGHGAGLCQFGAMAKLRAGALPSDVIGLYYPGTKVGRWKPRQT
jgi:stage II sporulation protein D